MARYNDIHRGMNASQEQKQFGGGGGLAALSIRSRAGVVS